MKTKNSLVIFIIATVGCSFTWDFQPRPTIRRDYTWCDSSTETGVVCFNDLHACLTHEQVLYQSSYRNITPCRGM